MRNSIQQAFTMINIAVTLVSQSPRSIAINNLLIYLLGPDTDSGKVAVRSKFIITDLTDYLI